MKKILLIILVLFAVSEGNSQVNLVPNGSFEENTLVNTCRSLLDSVNHWFSPTAGTPDYSTYYEFCTGPNSLNNPNGFQLPKDGLSYVGFYGFLTPTREYLAVELLSELEIGKTYVLDFYISLADESKYSIKNIGAAFQSETPNYSTLTTAIPVMPNIESDNGFLNDTINWIKISGEYLSNGTEKFLIIGNFFNDEDTQLELVNSLSIWDAAYYYIDDVTLYELTDVNSNTNPVGNSIDIYPNPFYENIYIKNENNSEINLQLFNLNNQNITNQVNIELENNHWKIHTKNLPAGIYFLTINNSLVKKLIKY